MTSYITFFINYVLDIISFAFNLPITDEINLGWFLIACCLIGLLLRIIFHSFGNGGNN